MAFFKPEHSLFYYVFPHNIFQVLAYALIFFLGAKFGHSLLKKVHLD